MSSVAPTRIEQKRRKTDTLIQGPHKLALIKVSLTNPPLTISDSPHWWNQIFSLNNQQC